MHSLLSWQHQIWCERSLKLLNDPDPVFLNQTGKTPIKDMFTDLKDGRRLLDLLEGLTGSVLVSR